MTIAKSDILDLVNRMPADVDVDELVHRLFLLQKLAAAEADIAAGRTYTQQQVRERSPSGRSSVGRPGPR